MKYKSLILILIFTIVFNFIFQPKIAYATAIPLAVKYGMPVAEKLIAFLLTCLAAGITYKTLDEAEKAFYNWLDSLPEYEPPRGDDNGQNGWRDAIKQFLKTGAITVSLHDLFTKIIEYFNGLESEEGENYIKAIAFNEPHFRDEKTGYRYYYVTEGSVVYPTFLERRYELKKQKEYREYKYVRFYFYRGEDGKIYTEIERRYDKYDYAYERYQGTYTDIEVYETTLHKDKRWGIDFTPWTSLAQSGFDFEYVNDISLIPDYDVINEVPYYVESDSSIITGVNPFETPEWYQPNILDIVPTKTVINPQGIKQIVYEGDTNDLVNDFINNVTFEDIMNSKKREPYNYIQDGESTIIQTGEESEVPYPDTDVEPVEDTQTGLGKIISFLKQIINWLSNIYNNISEIPKKIGELFIDTDNIESIDFSPITNISISSKFPFSIPWDIKRAVEKLLSEGKPPKWEIPIVTEVITIDMAEFEHLANIMRIFNTLIFIVVLIILTRRLI